VSGVVASWVAAVNAGDVPGALAVCTSNVEMTGSHGSGRGHPVLRAWIERARIHMDTRRAFARGQSVVLVQDATWRDEKGITIAQGTIVNGFVMASGLVARIARYDRLEDALDEAGLTAAHEVTA
jgi:hypothetical protein